MVGVDHIPLVVFEYGEDKGKEVNWKEIDWEGLPESWEGEIMSLCDRIRKNSRDTNDWLKEVVNNNYLDLMRSLTILQG